MMKDARKRGSGVTRSAKPGVSSAWLTAIPAVIYIRGNKFPSAHTTVNIAIHGTFNRTFKELKLSKASTKSAGPNF